MLELTTPDSMRGFFIFVIPENKCSDFVERAVKPRRSCRRPITRLRSGCAPTLRPTSPVVHSGAKNRSCQPFSAAAKCASAVNARSPTQTECLSTGSGLRFSAIGCPRLCPTGIMHSYTSKLKSIHWSNHWRLPKSSLPGSPESSPVWARTSSTAEYW